MPSPILTSGEKTQIKNKYDPARNALDQLGTDNVALKGLLVFGTKESSFENALFILALKGATVLFSKPDRYQAYLMYIANQFVKADSPMEINLPAAKRSDMMEKVRKSSEPVTVMVRQGGRNQETTTDTLSTAMFQPCVKEILALASRDTWKRFYPWVKETERTSSSVPSVAMNSSIATSCEREIGALEAYGVRIA